MGAHQEAVEALARQVIDGEWSAGLSIGLIQGHRTETYGFGRVSLDGDRKPDAHTIFEIGSATKLFTSTLLAEMKIRGLVELDQPVEQLLPSTCKVPSRDGVKITLLHLATHSSGLPRMPDNAKPANAVDPYADYEADRLCAFLAGHSLQRTPGAAYEYSNLGAGLLGYALSLRANKPYAGLVGEWIATPLGMTETALFLSPQLRQRLASGFSGELTPAPNWSFAALAGAGAVRSSVSDMLRFLEANLFPAGDDLGRALELTHTPRASRPGGTIGLGWHIGLGSEPSDHTLWHNGQTAGYHSFLAFDPVAQAGVVVLANTGSMVIDKLGIALMRMLRGQPQSFHLAGLAHLDAEMLDRYVGRYMFSPDFVLTISRKGNRLWARASGQGELPIYPSSETEFYYRGVDARLTFGRDGSGGITGLVLHQGGRDSSAPRER